MSSHPLPRDLRGYGEHPPVELWPGDTRAAVSLVINIEDGSERSVARGDDADDLGAHWLMHPVHPDHRNLDLESAFEYGGRAGIWRLLRLLRCYDAPATAFCCAAALQANPLVAAALVRDGHEIADHGLRWEPHTLLSADEERTRMTRSRELIEAATGQCPTTWYSRDGLTEHSRASMLAEGFVYDANSFNDDLPHPGTDELALPVLPYAGDTNDSALLRQYPTAASFASHLCDALDMLLDDPREGSAVLSVGLHPRLIGRPAYIGALESLLQRAREKGTWIATRAQILQHWRATTAA